MSAGMQYSRIFLLKPELISLLYTTCKKLIGIENGSKILRTSKKLYPNKRNVGVPIINNPIPNTDWKIESKTIISNSIISIIHAH